MARAAHHRQCHWGQTPMRIWISRRAGSNSYLVNQPQARGISAIEVSHLRVYYIE